MRFNRRDRGSALAELGPALFVLLILTIFPAMTILGMGAQYAFAWYHNHLVTEELAQRNAADGGGSPPAAGASVPVDDAAFLASPVGQMIHNGFDAQGLAKFTGVQQIKDDVVYYGADTSTPAKIATTSNRVEVVTKLSGKPFICIPALGFTHLDYHISSEAIREVVR